MKYQLPAALGILVSVYVSGEQGSYRTAAAAAQGPSTAAAAKGAVPRTPWGHPDLQGVWSTDLEIGVPVERPVELGEKAEMT
jgi:hypothetical protein